MTAQKNQIKNALLLLALMLLALPMVQNKFNLLPLEPLKGAITVPEKKYISVNRWFSGTYQQYEEKYITETFGFRPFFVRLTNQLRFSLFGKQSANSVIIGKNGYLFEEGYINAYFGQDYIGTDSIRQRIERLSYINDTLKKLGKNIILVFAAGKGSFYPEYIPDTHIQPKGITNYKAYVELANEYGITYIDFNSLFLKLKGKSKYPLYPQFGIHWSYYGACLAADSIIRFIETERNIDMPNLYWNSINAKVPYGTDTDISDGMNLLFKRNSFNMGYPEVKFESDSGKVKPSVLVIADSFYWEMFNFGISNAFSTSHFWYYNKQVYPESFSNPIEAHQISLSKEIANHDVIIVLATEATLPNLGWGFIENTYNHFKGITIEKPTPLSQKILNLKNYIRTDKKWMENIEIKAAEKGISIDSMISLDAIWAINNENNTKQ